MDERESLGAPGKWTKKGVGASPVRRKSWQKEGEVGGVVNRRYRGIVIMGVCVGVGC